MQILRGHDGPLPDGGARDKRVAEIGLHAREIMSERKVVYRYSNLGGYEAIEKISK